MNICVLTNSVLISALRFCIILFTNSGKFNQVVSMGDPKRVVT